MFLRGNISWAESAKELFKPSETEHQKTFFSLQTWSLAKSFEGLNSSFIVFRSYIKVEF